MLNKNNIPRHIAIIMDGNGRWAKERGFSRIIGHRQGAKRLKEIVQSASETGIEVVTFFAFSAENWNRPKQEINLLMRYLSNFLDKEIRQFDKNNIRFLAIGRKAPLPEPILEKISMAEEKTKNNKGLTVVLALNYGARQEIVDAAKRFANSVVSGKVNEDSLDIEGFGRYLYTANLPDPDLLIRTSGEMRLSNFLLWQLSYAELYFVKKYWPDFTHQDFKEAILEYQKRERRFGGISEA
ncbi:MAG: isoprenyl transferase [Candidatus Omnitrophota bacterium]|nr:isoprenyl transferase [Candidatus Omnitrophota bacterium]